MSRRRGTELLPQPPWTQAPSEVAAWLGSTGSRPTAPSRAVRQPRVKGYVGHLAPAKEHRLFQRLARLRFRRVNASGSPLSQALERLTRRMPPEEFRGVVAGARVSVRVREGRKPRLRIAFAPRLTMRAASKVLSRLGVDALDGTWL